MNLILKSLLPKWLFPEFFLDWELDNWQKIYKKQTGLLEIYYKNSYISLPQVIVFDNTKEKIKLDRFIFRLQTSKFKIDSSLETEEVFKLYRRYISLRQRKLFNELCLRLIDVKLQGNKTGTTQVIFETQEVEYFDYVRTNLCLDTKIKPNQKTLREKLHLEKNDCQLEELSNSLLANPLGINIMFFTMDGTLILQKRSPYTLVRPNEICSSVSGTLTPADISNINHDSQLENLSFSFFREGFEELGLNEDDIAIDKVDFLGVARELIRGGQPEIFLAAQVNLTKSQILDSYSQAKDKFESQSLLFIDIGSLATKPLDSDEERFALYSKIDELLAQYGKLIAVPLWANLAFWCKMRLN